MFDELVIKRFMYPWLLSLSIVSNIGPISQGIVSDPVMQLGFLVGSALPTQ